jgi:hypothetical protein
MSDSIPDDIRYLNFDELATSSGGGSRKRWILIGVLVGAVLYLVNEHPIATLEEFMLRWEKEPPIATMEEFLASLPPYSLQLAETNSSSPQAKALAWTMNHSQYSLYRLKQRYALALLYYSTNGQSWHDMYYSTNGQSWHMDGWLSDDNECRWNYCRRRFPLSGLSFFENGLDGSLPTELELLTDLEHMTFYDEHGALSGTIHSELYV